MKHYLITFYDEKLKPQKINLDQYRKIAFAMINHNAPKHIAINQELIVATSAIQSIAEIKDEPLTLPPPSPAPISAQKLQALKKQLCEKFSWT